MNDKPKEPRCADGGDLWYIAKLFLYAIRLADYWADKFYQEQFRQK